MNYFEMFGLPVQLKPDKSLVRKKYLELSKKSHPDYFVNSAADEQQNALEGFALLNKALKTLSNEDETIRYVLETKGLLEEDEKQQLPPHFLMQMLEVNEELADAQMEGNEERKKQLLQSLAHLENEMYEPVKNSIENYQEGVTSEKELLQVKDYYFKKKYLARLRHQFGEKL